MSSPYYSIRNRKPKIPVIAHLPHDSDYIPTWVLPQFSVSLEKLYDESRILTDWFTADLYSILEELGAAVVRYGVSRFVLDPERYADDNKEVMAERGMGVIYTKTSDGLPLRRTISLHERSTLLDTFYNPYHAAIDSLTREIIAHFGTCLIIDCHSHPALVQPYEIRQTAPRHDFSIGTDTHHTPPWISTCVSNSLANAGYSVGIDEPFSGSYVPLSLWGDERVSSFMIEVNKHIYLDEKTIVRSQRFPTTKHDLSRTINEVVGLFVKSNNTGSKNEAIALGKLNS